MPRLSSLLPSARGPRARRARVSAALALAAVGLAACATLPPTDEPPTFLLSWLDAQAPVDPQPYERRQGKVRIESTALSGTYTAVLIRRRGADPAVRLQLYPELGGRVLDLAATPTSVHGRLPQAGIELAWDAAEGAPPRHLFTFLAASLLAEAQALGAERALGAAPGPERSWRVLLTPPFEDLDLVARFDSFGAVEGYEYTLRGVAWEEQTRRPGRPRRFAGQDFTLTVLEEIATPVGTLSDELFRLESDAPAAGPR